MSLADRLAQERRARLAAERLLEQKQAELSEANRQLALHARALTNEITETREEVEVVRSEAETLKDENAEVKSDLAVAHKKAVLAERRLWDALTAIQDGFAVFDGKKRLVMANRAFHLPFDGLESIASGLDYEDLLDLALSEGIVDPGDQSGEAWKAEMLARWDTDVIEDRVIRLWNGAYVKLIEQRTRDGDIVSLALNITETIKREDALRDARTRAEAASRAKSAFLANMSHELRTPMNGVVGMADLLCDSGLSDEQRLYVETIKSSGEALLLLINDVLDYSKIEAGKLTLLPKPFDLERTIHEVIMLLLPTAQEKGIGIFVDYDIFLATRFVGDPGRVRQILINLIGNAIKFTPKGHVTVNVLGLPLGEDGDQRIHITVEDTGIGIAANMLNRIFGEFVQVEDERNRAFEGTGLGLSITRQLVELMGGEIWVESEEGEGTCFGFHLSLPLDEGEDQMPLRVPESLKHVVIADDHEVSRTILEKQLRAHALEVESFTTGAEALAAARTGGDLVFVADTLPDIDGLSLATTLEAEGSTAAVFLMARNPAGYVGAAGREAVAAVLQRPILRRELFDSIETLDFSGSEPAETAEPETPGEPEVPSGPRAMRILAADDNKTNRLVFAKMVKDLDLDLEFATDGFEAVAAYQVFRPDLVFMDISMPGMDGKDATREIRRIADDEGHPHTPIVAVTAHAMAGDDRAILDAGLDGYLTKPLRKPALLKTIEEYLPADARPVLTEPIPAKAAG